MIGSKIEWKQNPRWAGRVRQGKFQERSVRTEKLELKLERT